LLSWVDEEESVTAKIKEFPGISLSEKDFSDGKILYNFDKLNGLFAWDTGVGIGSYLASLKNGVILGSHCKTCRKVVVPPRTICEWCFRPMDEFVPLNDTGFVNTWDVQRIKDPEIPAVINIDGASPMHGIMHMLGEVDPQEVKIGMRVQAVWKPVNDRQGSINDILYFKPIQEK
jgi:uncharacterized OB-fold protein